MKKIVLLLLCLILVQQVHAQKVGISSQGREYFIGVVPPSFPLNSSSRIGKSSYEADIIITSATNNIVKVSYYDDQGHETVPDTFLITENASRQIPLKFPLPAIRQPI